MLLIKLIINCWVLLCADSHILGSRRLPQKVYYEPGDLLIASVFGVTQSTPTEECMNRINTHIGYIETFAAAVRFINKKASQPLNGLKIGFVILDNCQSESISALQAMRFMPVVDHQECTARDHVMACSFNDVIGVIGSDDFKNTISVANVLYPFDIPVINNVASGDISFQNEKLLLLTNTLGEILKATTSFLYFKQWLHFSVIYDPSRLGNIPLRLRHLSRNLHMCIMTFIQLSKNVNFEAVIQHLVKIEHQSKVVVVFDTESEILCRITTAMKSVNVQGRLVWIYATSGLGQKDWARSVPGSIFISRPSIDIPEINQAILSLNSSNPNPWFLESLDHMFDCRNNSCIADTLKRNIKVLGYLGGLQADGVNMLVNALAKLLSDYCPNAKSVQAVECFKKYRNEFRTNVANSNFQGYAGEIAFEDGEMVNHMSVYQHVIDETSGGSIFKDIAMLNISIDGTNPIAALEWRYFNFPESDLQPENSCAKQCQHHEYRLRVHRCCWRCRLCQQNQVVNANHTACVECPRLFWPKEDEEKCRKLKLVEISLYEPFSLMLLVSSLLGMASICGVSVVYWRNRESRVIKASSLEISLIQLLTLLWGFLSVPTLLYRADQLTCKIGVCLMTLPFNALYFSMLVKVIRVYRIFKISSKKIKIKYTSSKFQIMVVAVYMAIQIAAYIPLTISDPIRVIELHPDSEVPYAERSCQIPIRPLAPFFIQDFILLFLCSVFALKTKSLPSNFKESRYVSFCVMTNMIMWLTLFPAFFTAVRLIYKIYCIILAVLINHTTAIIFLFLPKIVILRNINDNQNSKTALD